MWLAYYNAYQDKVAEQKAMLQIKKMGSRILLIAGDADEAWPAEYSAMTIEKYLKDKKYDKDYKVIVYHNVSHLTRMIPNKKREKKIYFMIPFIGLIYKSFGKYKKECFVALEKSEQEIIE